MCAKKQDRGEKPRETKTDRTFWTQEEEKLLAEWFIEISEDPRNGSDQSSDTFWFKILATYNSRAEELGFKKRNKNMLTGKWTPMNKNVGEFNSIYDQTTALSGENDENLYTRWQNPESTKARRTRGQVTEEDPEMFGEDVIPRPSRAPRKTKSQRSSASSSATSSSSKTLVTELMQEQILIDREAKKESMDRELAARLAVCEIKKRNENLKILTFDTTGMALEDAAKIEALKEKARATYFNF
nr:glutathione S-transferase T3 [Tanacetum cinerariifolium]